jgi:outer membrane protein OmpA-like peptidoglycan-associated protein
MKKSVVLLGFYLWGAHSANAESLDGFFQDQAPAQQPASQDTPSDDTPKTVANNGPTVIKPQVLYLEDLNPPEKPKVNPPAATSTPAASLEAKAKTPSAAEPSATPVALPPPPLTPAKPTAGAASGAGKIKKEPLPKSTAQTPKAAPVAPAAAAAAAPTQAPVVQKSFIQNRSTRAEETQNNLPESSQTLSSFQEQHQGQYAPFATQTSRQQAAHSLVTQAKNEGRTYPAGLDPFVIEFDQTFAVLSPNRAIRDLYKTATITLPTVEDPSPLSFNATPTMPATPVVTLATPAPIQAVTAPESETEKTPDIQMSLQPVVDAVPETPQKPMESTEELAALAPESETEKTPDIQMSLQPVVDAVPETPQKPMESTEEVAALAPETETEKTPDIQMSLQPVVDAVPETPQKPMESTEEVAALAPETPNTLVLEDTAPTRTETPRLADREGPTTLATVMVPETAEMLDNKTKALLDQVAAAYHDGSLRVIQITGYVNTRSGQNEDVRGYTHIQSLGRRGAALVVDYLKGKNVPKSAMAYRIIPTSTIALQNPFYASLSTENTLRLDIVGGRS